MLADIKSWFKDAGETLHAGMGILWQLFGFVVFLAVWRYRDLRLKAEAYLPEELVSYLPGDRFGGLPLAVLIALLLIAWHMLNYAIKLRRDLVPKVEIRGPTAKRLDWTSSADKCERLFTIEVVNMSDAHIKACSVRDVEFINRYGHRSPDTPRHFALAGERRKSQDRVLTFDLRGHGESLDVAICQLDERAADSRVNMLYAEPEIARSIVREMFPHKLKIAVTADNMSGPVYAHFKIDVSESGMLTMDRWDASTPWPTVPIPADLGKHQRQMSGPAMQRVAESNIRISVEDFGGYRVREIDPGVKGKFVQFSVTPISESLTNCEARIVKIERQLAADSFELIEDEALLCEWSGKPHGTTRVDIPGGVVQFANSFTVREGKERLALQFPVSPRDLGKRMGKGVYRLTVRVTADKCQPEQMMFRLCWGGSYDHIGLEPW